VVHPRSACAYSCPNDNPVGFEQSVPQPFHHRILAWSGVRAKQSRLIADHVAGALGNQIVGYVQVKDVVKPTKEAANRRGGLGQLIDVNPDRRSLAEFFRVTDFGINLKHLNNITPCLSANEQALDSCCCWQSARTSDREHEPAWRFGEDAALLHRSLERAFLEDWSERFAQRRGSDRVALTRVDAEQPALVVIEVEKVEADPTMADRRDPVCLPRRARDFSDGSNIGPPTASNTTSAPRPSAARRTTEPRGSSPST
jgi:hypothetical protein